MMELHEKGAMVPGEKGATALRKPGDGAVCREGTVGHGSAVNRTGALTLHRPARLDPDAQRAPYTAPPMNEECQQCPHVRQNCPEPSRN